MRFTYRPMPEREMNTDYVKQNKEAFEKALDDISNPFVQDWVDALIDALEKHFKEHPKGPDDRLARHDAILAVAAMIWKG